VTTTAPQTQISGFRVALETCLSLKYLVFLSFRHKNTGKASSNKEAFVLKLNFSGVMDEI